jgi:SAM-dependent methyltransferase
MIKIIQKKPTLSQSVIRELRKVRRQVYAFRAYVPGLRFQHLKETMVGPVGYWDELQRYQLNVLVGNGLRPAHTLLDLCCGPLQGGMAFIRYLDTGGYVGVDINARNLAAGYRQILDQDLASKNPRLIRSEAFGRDFLGDAKFDFIFVSQTLYLFDDEKMAELLSLASRVLKPGGKFLGDILKPDLHASLIYPDCGWLCHTAESLDTIAESQGMTARSLGEISQFRYPGKLSLSSNLMIEFTRKT